MLFNKEDSLIYSIVSDVIPLAFEIADNKPVALVFENKEPFNVNLNQLNYGSITILLRSYLF
jgi:hypothetical protein